MLEVIVKDDVIYPDPSLIANELYNIVWSNNTAKLFKCSQLTKIKERYMSADFINCKFKGLNTEAKNRLLQIQLLNKEYYEAITTVYINNI